MHTVLKAFVKFLQAVPVISISTRPYHPGITQHMAPEIERIAGQKQTGNIRHFIDKCI